MAPILCIQAFEVLIGLTGLAGSGKSTIAKALGYPVLSFADPIRDQLGITKADPHYRKKMQDAGMWGRAHFGEDVWVENLRLRLPQGYAVIDDVRFANEAEFIRERGVLVHILRFGTDKLNHISEQGVTMKGGDCVEYNNGSILDAVKNLKWQLGL